MEDIQLILALFSPHLILFVFGLWRAKEKLRYAQNVSFIAMLGAVCSLYPMLHLGLIFGAFAYTLFAIILAMFMDFKR